MGNTEKFLKPLDPKNVSKPHCTFDIESNKWTQFEMAGFYDGVKYTLCPSIDDLFDCILTERNRNRVIFAHNGGRFDFLFLMEHLKNVRNKECRFITQGPRVTALKIAHGKRGWITLQDSYTLLAYNLDELCKVFEPSTVKLTGTIDFERERVDKNNPLHLQYLRADCIALWEIIQKYRGLPFVRDVGLKLTRSSVGLAAWRTTLKEPIRVTPRKVQDFSRDAYAGGRCEIFRQHLENGVSVDVTSLYPAMMLKPLPVEWLGEAKGIEDFGFHDVTVEVPECYIPILWKKLEGKLIFPTGIFRGKYFSEEIHLAISQGAKIIKYHGGHRFTERTDLFSEYIQGCFRMRQENPYPHPLNILGKDLANHCYGKTAEREEKKSLIKLDMGNPSSWPKSFQVFHSDKMFQRTGFVQIEKVHRSPHMLCHIAAAITAHGRCHMARSIYLPEWETIAYTDTDSGKLRSEIPATPGLGGLKREYPIKRGFYLLPKGYYEELPDGKIIKKLKGFSRKALESITWDTFQSGKISTMERKLGGFRSSLIRENTFLSLLDQRKSVINEYSKRKILKGGETRPWEITKEGKIR